MPLDPEAELLEEYRAALQSYIFEGNAFWTRISAFVLLNSALLVARNALPAGAADRWTRVAISLLGIAASVLWAHTAVRAHYITAFWLAFMRELEDRLAMGLNGPYTLRERYLAGLPVRLRFGTDLRLPWYGRVNVNDSTSMVLTTVFGAVWIVAIFRSG
jgi:hypothetical protein